MSGLFCPASYPWRRFRRSGKSALIRRLRSFVHGSLCIAYSGRCLLSGYINKRDPNQGTCTNACRWQYQAHEAKETESGDVIPASGSPEMVTPTLGTGETSDSIFLLQEKGRPDQYMPAFEDEHGTYIMNSRDLRAVQHVRRFTEMGIHSLKIEGRTKSFYYVARTAQVYRQAIDDALGGCPRIDCPTAVAANWSKKSEIFSK